MKLMEYSDKRSAPFRRLQPVLLCNAAQRQIEAVWDHLAYLRARLSKLNTNNGATWHNHLDAVLREKPAPLLFLVQRGRAIPVATAHCQVGIDRSSRLAPNAGRHFWQTTLLDRAVSSEAVDVWARHSSNGIEPMTSTSMASIDSIRQRVCQVQDQVMQELGIGAFRGLGTGGWH